MKVTKKTRKSIASAENITSLIKNKLKEKSEEVKDKVDLTKIAKDLADRRERVNVEENTK